MSSCDPPFHFIRCYANKLLETNMPQVYALAGDSSGIAPRMGDDHACLQSFGIVLYICTYTHICGKLSQPHNSVGNTWSNDASPSPHLIYSFF